MKERIVRHPDSWGFFVGGFTLPVLHFCVWLHFASLFPEVEAASRVDDITAHTSLFADGLFDSIISFPLVGLWGGVLGLVSELFWRAHRNKKGAGRWIGLLGGTVGIWFLGRSLWVDWPTLYHNRASSPEFATGVMDAVLVAVPLL